MRTCYLPDTWPLRVFVCDPHGHPREVEQGVERALQNVVGPCCFSGDVVAPSRKLPLIRPGDVLVIADTGAYTLSMYSRYNSRCVPPVVGYSLVQRHGEQGDNLPGAAATGSDGQTPTAGKGQPDAISFAVLKRGETVDDIVKFWSE